MKNNLLTTESKKKREILKLTVLVILMYIASGRRVTSIPACGSASQNQRIGNAVYLYILGVLTIKCNFN